MINHKEEVNKVENDNLGSVAILLLSKYTALLDDYKAIKYLNDDENFDSMDFKNIENLVQLKHLVVKLKTTIDNNHCLVEYNLYKLKSNNSFIIIQTDLFFIKFLYNRLKLLYLIKT